MVTADLASLGVTEDGSLWSEDAILRALCFWASVVPPEVDRDEGVVCEDSLEKRGWRSDIPLLDVCAPELCSLDLEASVPIPKPGTEAPAFVSRLRVPRLK